jgi:N-acetylmuramoyl-L-alanine amidase
LDKFIWHALKLFSIQNLYLLLQKAIGMALHRKQLFFLFWILMPALFVTVQPLPAQNRKFTVVIDPVMGVRIPEL